MDGEMMSGKNIQIKILQIVSKKIISAGINDTSQLKTIIKFQK